MSELTVTQRVGRRSRKLGTKIVSRREWGNTSNVYNWRRSNRKHNLLPHKPADTLWQHITVTHDLRDFNLAMRTLHRIGMDRFSSGVSYNYAISMRTGRIGGGQALDARGTHTVNHKNLSNFSYDQNAVSIAIAFIGMPGDILSDEAVESAATLIAAMILEGALTLDHDYMPHSAATYKECPTEAVRKRMPEINRRAKQIVKKQRSQG